MTNFNPPNHETHGPREARTETSTEQWRLENAARDLARAEHALHGTPPNMHGGESVFRPFDPMAHYNDTRLENDVKDAQAAYDQAKAAYDASVLQQSEVSSPPGPTPKA